MKKISMFSILLIIIDQIIKILIDQNVAIHESIPMISDFFHITYVRNTGAAFSILNGSRFFFIIMGVIAIYFIYRIIISSPKLTHMTILIASLLISGIIGNMIDRIVRGYVIDYFHFQLFGYSFPIFNFADICIVLGALLLFWMTQKEESNGNQNNDR